MRCRIANFALAAGFAAFMSVSAHAADTIKIAYIDPLSGGMAAVGELGLKTFQYVIDEINAQGGVDGKKLEIVGFDNKVNPQESLIQAQKAADQGIRIITQGNGSSVAAALTDFVAKYNDRNPGQELIYFNYAAVDPALTNEKCNYWHFRMDANSDIKMSALTTFIQSRQNVKKVYLINQDYSFGHSVRKQALAMLKEKRPDIQIVGDELHPLAKVTDFSPYIAKIKASGADTVITGNWGQDIALLLKAAADAGLQVDWYTYYAGGPGGPTAIKQAGPALANRVFVIAEGFSNSGNAAGEKYEAGFREKVGASNQYPRAINEIRMLVQAIKQAKSDDPKAIAAQLEGMKIEALDGGEAFMRKDDHQMFQDMYIASFGPLDGKDKFDEEKTGWGWKVIGTVKAKDTVLPTTCNMDRPS
jgi:branched-chain amino acid transport system substrate-binding protein